MVVIEFVLLALIGYFVGNFNIAIFISKKLNNDITKVGSGNPGSMNMLRNFGIKYGMITLIFDMLKGIIPSLLGLLLLGEVGLYVGGVAVVFGHIFPVFHNFKGGKGVASTTGVMLVANPILTFILFALMMYSIYLFKYGSLSTLLYILIITVTEICLVQSANWVNYILISIIFMLVYFAHRSNIKRLLTGKEVKTEFKKNGNIRID